MADTFKEKSWTLAGAPEGFFVKGLKKGPLKRGEAGRAAAWAKGIVGSKTKLDGAFLALAGKVTRRSYVLAA